MPVSSIIIIPCLPFCSKTLFIIPIQLTLLGMYHFHIHVLSQTIIPIQLTLLGMHHFHMSYHPYSANLAGHESFPHVLPQTIMIIPIQLTLLGMQHYSHILSQSFSKAEHCSHNSCECSGHASLIPAHWIEVDIERLLFSLTVKMPNFWGPKIDRKVINSKCLISLKIAILTPHIKPSPLVN